MNNLYQNNVINACFYKINNFIFPNSKKITIILNAKQHFHKTHCRTICCKEEEDGIIATIGNDANQNGCQGKCWCNLNINVVFTALL